MRNDSLIFPRKGDGGDPGDRLGTGVRQARKQRDGRARKGAKVARQGEAQGGGSRRGRRSKGDAANAAAAADADSPEPQHEGGSQPKSQLQIEEVVLPQDDKYRSMKHISQRDFKTLGE